jgi:pantetheine-phosphate adenylyltransferase
VGIGINADKRALFTPDERVELVTHATEKIKNVQVKSFANLAVEFVRECGARVMVRGVRPLTDLAGEFTMMMANRHLDPGIETVFLMADEEFAHVSSSLIKQITPLASDEMLARFVPQEIIPMLRAKLAQPAGRS